MLTKSCSEMSNARSPLFSHFGAVIGGLTSIQAYGAEVAFKSESLKRVDKYTCPARTFYNLNRYERLVIYSTQSAHFVTDGFVFVLMPSGDCFRRVLQRK